MDDIAEGRAPPGRHGTHLKVAAGVAVLAAVIAFVVVHERQHDGAADKEPVAGATNSAHGTPADVVREVGAALARRAALRGRLDDALRQILRQTGKDDSATYRLASIAVIEQLRVWLTDTATQLRALAAVTSDTEAATLATATADAFASDAEDLLVAENGIHGIAPVDERASGDVVAELSSIAGALQTLTGRLGSSPPIDAALDITIVVPDDLRAALARQFDTDDGVWIFLGGIWLDPASGRTHPASASPLDDALAVGSAVVATSSQDGLSVFRPGRAAVLFDRQGTAIGPGPDANSVWARVEDDNSGVPKLGLYTMDGKQLRKPAHIYSGAPLGHTGGTGSRYLLPESVGPSGTIVAFGDAPCGQGDMDSTALATWDPPTGETHWLSEGCTDSMSLGSAGTTVAWASYPAGHPSRRSVQYFVTDLLAGTSRRAASSSAATGCGSYMDPFAASDRSADGRWLAVTCAPDGGSGNALLLIDATAKRNYTIPLQSAARLTWLPTGVANPGVLYVETYDDIGSRLELLRIEPRDGAPPIVTKALHPVPGLFVHSPTDLPPLAVVPRAGTSVASSPAG